MPLSKCPRTGKLFDNSHNVVHPDAQALEEEDYTKILDYVAEHPNAKMAEIIEETGVTPECIQRMIKVGRLREMDQHALSAQAEEYADRAAEVAKRNQRVAGALNQVLRQGAAGGKVGSSGGSHSSAENIRSTLQHKRDKL
jgi:hypothetical protein